MSINPALYSSDSGEWGTPRDLFDRLDAEFCFGLDAAASAQNAKCRRYYTKEDDALVQDWADNTYSGEAIYLNPPYGREIGPFVAKAYAESQRGCTVVCLLPMRCDTEWWFQSCFKAAEWRIIHGRLRFEGATNSAPFPSVIVVFRPGTHTLKVMSMEARG